MIVLNRDLVGSMIPRYSYQEVMQVESDSSSKINPHQRALAELAGFADTFDPERFTDETGSVLPDESDIPELTGRIGQQGETDLELGTLRWAISTLAHPMISLADETTTGDFVDRVLDGIHWHVTRAERKVAGPGPSEPWIGTAAAEIASGQRRFFVTTGNDFDRNRLFDFVAGLLLREYGKVNIARSLGMYPPEYATDHSELVTHVFMFLIQGRDLGNGDDREQGRFAEAAKRKLLQANLGVVPTPD